jgi:hypothetical protein
MIQITVCRRGQFQGAEANVIQRLIVDAKSFIRVLHQLMYGQRRVVRLDNSIGNLVDDKILRKKQVI